MITQQEATRQRLREIVERSGLPLTTLAKRAGLAPSTLTRFMNFPVNHVLSTTTLAKLEAVCPVCQQPEQPPERPDNAFLRVVGRRMHMVRQAIAPTVEDAMIADLIGWSEAEMAAIFAGEIEPTLSQFYAFAMRMRVTMDFLANGVWDGLSRQVELRLLHAFPELLTGNVDPEPSMRNTRQPASKADWRR